MFTCDVINADRNRIGVMIDVPEVTQGINSLDFEVSKPVDFAPIGLLLVPCVPVLLT